MSNYVQLCQTLTVFHAGCLLPSSVLEKYSTNSSTALENDAKEKDVVLFRPKWVGVCII